MRRSVKAFIICSILLNLLLIGIFFGQEGKYFLWPREDIAKALSADKYKLYQETMRHTEESNRALREQMTEARKRAADILKADPFNRQAYLAQIKNMQDLRAQMMQRMAESIAGLAEEFSPEDRAILADTFRRPNRRNSYSHSACEEKPQTGSGGK